MSPNAAFDGYPYLATRIGHTPLRHLAVVPADWSRERLIELARRQAEANQLDTCLCLGLVEAVYISSGREPREAAFVPSGVPVVDRLALAEPVPETAELSARRAALLQYAEDHKGSGYLVGDGLGGGRPATAEELARLAGRGVDGHPPRHRRCPVCGSANGESLARRSEGDGDLTPRVITVHCVCENHNRCARCGGPLAKHRLSAHLWDDELGKVMYVAAYAGLSHRCAT